MKTARDKIVTYLGRCKVGKTHNEIANGAKVNYNTTRRVVAEMFIERVIVFGASRKCSITDRDVPTWVLAEAYRAAA